MGRSGCRRCLPGSYTVKAAASGFRTLLENATVQVGQATTLDLVMQVGAAERSGQRAGRSGADRL